MSKVKAGAGVVAAATLAAVGLGVAAPDASAAPWVGEHYVKTVRCSIADPWPAPRIPVAIDIYSGIKFPSDGLPGPAISLRANDIRSSGQWGNVTEYTISTTVKWKNLRTGRSGRVAVPTRTTHYQWEAVVHPGTGPVRLTIKQKAGAMAWNPMVNPQYRTCTTTAPSFAG
ncbi:hypothetical protein L5G32_14485 [Gordonia sp. HY002]|uniref:hypothetical protein n=1 Tax=Gordonia zhenghanii TaxID=2911516 RepID=UPI001EEF9DF6|nr:hypothetical protein [Gordonia zhenghanii]MCF8571477.1 hypothetical protein [Gordonia zhenghanii]MCF8607282.1 hypothetical protein [Gordonia zhenghanii]